MRLTLLYLYKSIGLALFIKALFATSPITQWVQSSKINKADITLFVRRKFNSAIGTQHFLSQAKIINYS
jgi:hypothetical protein